MNPEHLSALQGMAFCRTLDDAERRAIAALLEPRSLGAGAELFREGDPGDGLYLIVSGEVEVMKRTAQGEQPLARLTPGGVLGEMSLVTSDARSATGRALSPCRLLLLPAAAFRAQLAAGSPAAYKVVAAIAEVLARRLATMNGVVLRLADVAAPAAGARSPMKTQDLVDLHRTMQVWSF